MNYTIPVSQKLKKLIRSLHQKQHRDFNGLFIAEGDKLSRELLTSSYQVELILVRDQPSSDTLDLMETYIDKGTPIYSAPKHLFDQMCDSITPQGILAVVNKKETPVDVSKNILVIDGINDPGNLGTIVRTADWFGFNNILLSDSSTDILNPKAVRASMGSVFRSNVQYVPDLVEFLKKNYPKIKFYNAVLNAKKTLDDTKPEGQFGVIFGSESHGISENLLKFSKNNFTIKGYGNTESLNVSVAVGISLNHFATFNSGKSK